MENVLGVFGIGCGPFNLSVAILAKKNHLSSLFVDEKNSMSWHSGMMLPFATIQNSHIRDLVSLIDPCSSYTFNNFLLETGRLEEHTIADFKFTKRWEFEQYLQWVVSHLDNVKFGIKVEEVSKNDKGFFVITTTDNEGTSKQFYAKNIVLGTGVSPIIPDFASNFSPNTFFHNSTYNFKDKRSVKDITIIGGGQSALEICLDILTNYTNVQNLSVIYQEPFIHQIEASQFAEDVVFSSWGIDEYYKLSSDVKDKLLPELRFTSDGASLDTIKELYQLLYQNKYLTNRVNFRMYNHSKVIDINYEENYSLLVKDLHTNCNHEVTSEMVILATGYKQLLNKEIFNKELLEEIAFEDDKPKLDENYCIYQNELGFALYIVNGGKHSFGVSDPNLSLSAIRANKIISVIKNKEGK